MILMGRLVRDPEIRYTQGSNPSAVAKYTLAVDRRYNRDGEQTADFINCVCFGKLAEVVEKWYQKGTKIAISGRIQTGSYTNKDGAKVYTTDVVVEDSEFAETKPQSDSSTTSRSVSDGFMRIPEGDEELPFN